MCGLKRRSSNTMTYLNLTWTTGRTNMITFDWINTITRRKLIWIHGEPKSRPRLSLSSDDLRKVHYYISAIFILGIQALPKVIDPVIH